MNPPTNESISAFFDGMMFDVPPAPPPPVSTSKRRERDEDDPEAPPRRRTKRTAEDMQESLLENLGPKVDEILAPPKTFVHINDVGNQSNLPNSLECPCCKLGFIPGIDPLKAKVKYKMWKLYADNKMTMPLLTIARDVTIFHNDTFYKPSLKHPVLAGKYEAWTIDVVAHHLKWHFLDPERDLKDDVDVLRGMIQGLSASSFSREEGADKPDINQCKLMVQCITTKSVLV